MPQQTAINSEGQVLDTFQAMNDLIGNPPSWLMRSGITMVGIVVGTVMLATYFISYPNKLSSTGILTAENPPIELISRATGYIENMHKEEGAVVEKGEPVVYISNTTDKDQLRTLEQWITKYRKVNDPRQYLNLTFPSDLQLGSIQADYGRLQLQYNELCRTLKDGVVFQQMNNLTREIIKIRSLNQSQEREKEIYGKELAIANKDHNRNDQLLSSGTISEVAYEKAKTTLLQKERQYESMNNTIIQNNIRMEQLSLEKLKLQEERSNIIKKYQFSIAEAITNLKTGIKSWGDTYTMHAPIAGTVTYTSVINPKRTIEQGQLLGYVTPKENAQSYISAKYPTNNLGKIEKGQKVILKFDAYPYKEYGTVISKVGNIGSLPEVNKEGKSYYEIQIPVASKILTDYDKEIPYKPNMTAQVEVITEDRSIFERIFDQFLRLTKDI